MTTFSDQLAPDIGYQQLKYQRCFHDKDYLNFAEHCIWAVSEVLLKAGSNFFSSYGLFPRGSMS